MGLRNDCRSKDFNVIPKKDNGKMLHRLKKKKKKKKYFGECPSLFCFVLFVFFSGKKEEKIHKQKVNISDGWSEATGISKVSQ